MAVRKTIERILRDDDDMSGQTIRSWKIEAEDGSIVIRMNHGDGFIMLRADDVGLLVSDLYSAKELAVDNAVERLKKIVT